jgi:DNA mismatch repair protein MutS
VYPPGAKRLTPVMRQYEEAKNAFPDAILFFRLGDFYEMFNQDAVTASRELGLTLTSRNKGEPGEVPMAGVPHHAAHNYLARLIARGYKVAICEQLGDPAKCKGIVPRKVVRVITAGLLTDAEQLDARRHNFLVALDGDADDDECGVALLDLSTGELGAASIGGRALLFAELGRADPSELLVPASLAELRSAIGVAAPRAQIRQDEPLDDRDLPEELDRAVAAPLYRDAARDHPRRALRAAARALRFARSYLPGAELPVRRIARHDPEGCLQIDETAQRHLELVRGVDGSLRGSLLEVVDATVTPAGARLLRQQLLAPVLDALLIRRRLDAVELFVTHPRARQELREALRRVGDLCRLAVRALLREATPRDLGGVRDSLMAAPDALRAIQSIPRAVPELAASAPDPSAGTLQPRSDEILDLKVELLPELAALLGRALAAELPPHAREGGMLREGYDPELDRLRTLRRDGAALLAGLELRLRAETAIASLKVKYTRVFGWYIEVTRTHLDKVPSDWRRKQTLATAERYDNPELLDLADQVLHAEERYSEREAELFGDLARTVADAAEPLRRLAAAIAQWDVSSALAEVAHRNDYCRPTVDQGERIELSEARHPVVERFVTAGRFVPNDTTLDLEGERFLVITGPNMAGKSTLMRQVALNVILAQMGSYVAARNAHVGLVDRVLSRVGASDDLARGASTFMVEMRETASILRQATRRSLVILDEIGRGTSTYDGLAIAWAVSEHLHDAVGCRVLFATHYHQLTELAERFEGIANYSVSAREHAGDIVFLHRLTPGSVSRSYGVAVARLAGLPEGVLARAGAMLAALEAGEGPGAAPQRADHGSTSTREPDAQLDLFRRARSSGEPDAARHAACEALRTVEPDRMTPLEALQLLVKLKAMVEEEGAAR